MKDLYIKIDKLVREYVKEYCADYSLDEQMVAAFAYDHAARTAYVMGFEDAKEQAACLFDPYSNGHKQEFTGGAEDSVALTFRVMTIIEGNIRAIPTPKLGDEDNE